MPINVEHAELKITQGSHELKRICDHYWPFSGAINQLREKVNQFEANFEGKAIGEKFEAFEALYASVSETITTMEKERAGEDEHE